jgi:hypothetical protein
MHAKLRAGVIVWIAFCALQTLQFIRFYTVSTIFYLSMSKYLAGQERMPFQERVLPIGIIKWLYRSPWFMRFVHGSGPFTSERAPFYILSLITFVIAGIFVQKLYHAVTRTGTLFFLVYPVFLFAALWTYVMHVEANFSYPYDMPSLAFFCAGVYFIYTRKFIPLLIVMFLGTLNRETTLFLIGIYTIDAASVASATRLSRMRDRFSPGQVPWLRVAVLCVLWVGIKLALARHYAHNDQSENFVRFLYNTHEMGPRMWPALLNICGYLLPIAWLFRANLGPIRFANYLFIMPLWFGIMFYTGVMVETRIYGELCGYTAVAIVLIAEQYIAQLSQRSHDSEPYFAAPGIPLIEHELEIPEHTAA